MELIIDTEFKGLCRPLTEDEYVQLEHNVVAAGCREAILTWNGAIIDGHNRYKICRKHNIDFHIAPLLFDTRDEAKLWIVNNQLGRRNLSSIDRVALLEVKRPILKAQADARMKAGKGKDGSGGRGNKKDKNPAEDFTEGLSAGEISESLAKEAGVSRPVYNALRKINESGSEELKQAVREKKVSASAGAQIAKLPIGEQAVPEKEKVARLNKPKTRGSFDNWIVYKEKADRALAILEDMTKLKVDRDRIFYARQYVEKMQLRLDKILNLNQ